MTELLTERSEPRALLQPGLDISITSGLGQGPTTLAAFDAALRDAGIANFNLIRLSSVVPTGSAITVNDGRPLTVPGDWGDRLYVVLAESRVDTPHEEAWAGIGWTQDESTGRGLFVEHHGHAEAQVVADIESSLDALIDGRPEVEFGPISMEVRGRTCTEAPVCAVVLAVFESTPWKGPEVIVLS